MDPHRLHCSVGLRIEPGSQARAGFRMGWGMIPRAGLPFMLGLLLIGCGGWQKLPAYPTYFTGEFVPDPRIKQGGFYCIWDSIVDYSRTDELRVQCKVLVLYFYADGAVFKDAAYGLPTKNALDAFHKIRTFNMSERGQRFSKEYGYNWGMYTIQGDTLEHQFFFPINGAYRAVHTLYLIQDDGSLRFLGGGVIHRDWPGPKPKPTFVEDGEVRHFQPTDWIPDSTEFLLRNERFVRHQLRRIKPPPQRPPLP